MLGNFPQAFSHVGLVNSAANLERGLEGPRPAAADGAPAPCRPTASRP